MRTPVIYEDADGCQWRVEPIMRTRSTFGPYILPGRVVLRFERLEPERPGMTERFAFNVPARWRTKRALDAAFRDSRPG